MRAPLVALALLLAGPVAAADPPRAASTTLCGDQYLLTLAEPAQIVSLSWQATGPLSHYAERARGYPTNRGSAEEVILSHGVDPQTRRVLDAFEITHVEVESVPGFDGVARNVRRVAAALGRPAAGEAAIAAMRARLDALRGEARGPDPLVAYFRPDGGGAAADTFVDAALRAAGYRNLQRELGQRGWSRLPAEALVRHPPDGFVVSFFDTTAASVSTRLRRNPILDAAMARGTVIAVPGRFWLCAHPLLVDAAELLARERTRLLAPEPEPGS
ncbi:MAG: ABC transporter substrate-binding protein [Deinococcus-Thermus bacterium]|jgi:iron complex transport system substrate-binding protein|nr:ABC transporter substrate-binding protein [Deinococcota bacterium]